MKEVINNVSVNSKEEASQEEAKTVNKKDPLAMAQDKADAVFAEFEKFTMENPGKPIPKYLEDKNRLAEENIERSKKGEPLKEDVLEVGKERIAKAGMFVENAKTNTKTFFNKAFGGVSKFFSRAEKFGGVALTAAVQPEVFLKKADEWIDNKEEQLAQGAEEVAKYIATKTAENLVKAQKAVEKKYSKAEAQGKGIFAKAKIGIFLFKRGFNNEMNRIREEKIRKLQEQQTEGHKKEENMSEQIMKLTETREQLKNKIRLLEAVDEIKNPNALAA